MNLVPCKSRNPMNPFRWDLPHRRRRLLARSRIVVTNAAMPAELSPLLEPR